MDADYDPSQQPVCKKKRQKERHEKKKKTKEDAPLMGKKRKKSHFAEIINKNKPVFDPSEYWMYSIFFKTGHSLYLSLARKPAHIYTSVFMYNLKMVFACSDRVSRGEILWAVSGRVL